jgi:RimJ/RimL family protein N-acetyltransferase
LGWPRHQSIADTRQSLAFSAAEWERSNGDLLGSTGLGFEHSDEAITGYVLAKDAWGKGYATEALTAMVEVSRRINVARIYALCHPQHRASWRVLEKCGFTRDLGWFKKAEFPNLAPGVLQDVLCYKLVLETNRKHTG